MHFKPGLRVNPLIVKELRSRMRGARAFATLTGVLLLLGAVSYALYRVLLSTMRYSGGPLSPQIGQALFTTLAFLELIMVCAITPAVTAGAISGEQEKLTYEMLLATPLRPASILWGKLVSALSYVFLLIFAAVPMASLVFIFGGVTPRDMIKALVILVIVAVTLGVLGLFMSAWLRRTGRATVLSYLVVLALLIGPLLVYVLVGIMRQAEPPRWILVPNPMSALFSAMTPATPSPAAGGLLFGLSMGLSGNLSALSSG
ncbi:MAG: ABC transporter permease subunit, partial [Anaerolineae bacterium]